MTTKQWLLNLIDGYQRELIGVVDQVTLEQYIKEDSFVASARRLVEQGPEEPTP